MRRTDTAALLSAVDPDAGPAVAGVQGRFGQPNFETDVLDRIFTGGRTERRVEAAFDKKSQKDRPLAAGRNIDRAAVEQRVVLIGLDVEQPLEFDGAAV